MPVSNMNLQLSDFLSSGHLVKDLLTLVNEGIFVLDECNQLAMTSDAAVTMFSLNGQQMLEGRHFREFFAQPDEGDKFITSLNLNGCLQNVEVAFVGHEHIQFTGVCS